MVMQYCSEKSYPSTHNASLPSECRIFNNLYIGDFKLALRVLLEDDHLGVTHVLSLVSSSILSSMCRNLPAAPSFKKEKPIGAHFESAKQGSRLLRMVVPLLDTPDEDILQVMQPCFEFINEGRRQGTVLVHCMAGRSRSAAVVVGYLMWSMGLTLRQAMDIANRTYNKVSPNVGFIRQLESLEDQLRKSPKGYEEIFVNASKVL